MVAVVPPIPIAIGRFSLYANTSQALLYGSKIFYERLGLKALQTCRPCFKIKRFLIVLGFDVTTQNSLFIKIIYLFFRYKKIIYDYPTIFIDFSYGKIIHPIIKMYFI